MQIDTSVNPLLAALEEQLRFSPRVMEVTVRPLLDACPAGDRELQADFLVSTISDRDGVGERIAIVVDDAMRPQEKVRWDCLRDWCAAHGVEFRVLGRDVIETAYLDNARRFARLVGLAPDPQGKALACIDRHVALGRTTPEETMAVVLRDGIRRLEAEDTLERCIANGWILCDLMQPYGMRSEIWAGNGYELSSYRSDPLLRRILDDGHRWGRRVTDCIPEITSVKVVENCWVLTAAS